MRAPQTGFQRIWLSAVVLVLAACGADDPNKSGTAPAANAEGVSAAPPNRPITAPTPGAPQPETEVSASDETAPTQISETDEEAPAESAPAVAAPAIKVAVAPPAPPASRFQEGVHYRRLSPTQPTNVPVGQVEVVEVFWYGCGACFAIDPKLEAWRAKAASYVAFERIPATWNEITRFHARLFYTAEALGKLEAVHMPIFREIHTAENPLNTVDRVSAFFAAHGVSKADYQKTFASFAVESKLQRADVLNRRYRVQGTPHFVVNGKYTTDTASAGGESQLLQLLSELAARERAN
jgi:thiol:disulfide interchange protein DsbA